MKLKVLSQDIRICEPAIFLLSHDKSSEQTNMLENYKPTRVTKRKALMKHRNKKYGAMFPGRCRMSHINARPSWRIRDRHVRKMLPTSHFQYFERTFQNFRAGFAKTDIGTTYGMQASALLIYISRVLIPSRKRMAAQSLGLVRRNV